MGHPNGRLLCRLADLALPNASRSRADFSDQDCDKCSRMPMHHLAALLPTDTSE
jgi:hypothetical protein